MINGKQITIAWHVDDLKISHVDPEVVKEIIEKLKRKYGKDAKGNKRPLTIKRGKTHEYLGMLLYYRTTGKVKINMTKYAEKILQEVECLFRGTCVTPAANHLLKSTTMQKR